MHACIDHKNVMVLYIYLNCELCMHMQLYLIMIRTEDLCRNVKLFAYHRSQLWKNHCLENLLSKLLVYF